MNKVFFEGCGTALVTPFKDGAVDYNTYAHLIEYQVVNGVDFLVALATTGETPTLSNEEKIELLKLTKAHAKNCPIVVGCGSNSLNGTLANMSMLEPYGVDAWLVVVPFYNKPTQEGQYQYFKAVAQAATKPVIIYNVPGRTGANMSAYTTLRLAKDCPNIVGIKEASGNYSQVSEILRNRPENFSVLSGDDDMTFAFMATGAQGVISVASNLVPKEVSAMTRAMLKGELLQAREIHHKLSPLFKNCFVESNPIPVKAAMALRGLCQSEVRLPLSQASDKTIEIMKQTIAEL